MMIRPGLLAAVAVLAVAVGIALIPVPKATPDFSRHDRTTASSPREGTTAFRDTRWDELMPENWDPYKALRELQQGMPLIPDTDPRAVERLKRVRDFWNDAPTNRKFDGATVRIPGYIVSLEESKSGIKEFLLVPYFGACIHTPPPPSNQIIHVIARQPVHGIHAMDTVWVKGKLAIERQDSTMGVSSYGMAAVAVEPYVSAPRQ